MKTVEEIEKEYSEFDVAPEIISATSLETYIEFGLDELEHSRLEVLRDKRSTYFAEKLAKAVDFIMFKTLGVDMDYFKKYNAILDDIFNLEAIFTVYLQRLQDSITEDNYQELFRLVRFIEKYHNEIFGYYESERHIIDASFEGVVIENFSDNNLEAFQEFARKKLDEYSPIKGVEKIKQM